MYLVFILNAIYFELMQRIAEIDVFSSYPIFSKVTLVALGVITSAAMVAFLSKNSEKELLPMQKSRFKPIPTSQVSENIDLLGKALPLDSLRFLDQKYGISDIKEENVSDLAKYIKDLDASFNGYIPEEVKLETASLKNCLAVADLSCLKRIRFVFLRAISWLVDVEKKCLDYSEVNEFRAFMNSGFFFFKTDLEKWKNVLGQHKESLPFLNEMSESSFAQYQKKVLLRALSFNLYQIKKDLERNLIVVIDGKEVNVKAVEAVLPESLQTEDEKRLLLDLIDSCLLKEQFNSYNELKEFLEDVRGSVKDPFTEKNSKNIATFFCLLSLLDELDNLPDIDLEKKTILSSLIHQGTYADAQKSLQEEAQALYGDASLSKAIVTRDLKVFQTIHPDIKSFSFMINVSAGSMSEEEGFSSDEKKYIEEVILPGKDPRFPGEEGMKVIVDKIGNYGTYEVCIESDIIQKSQQVSYKCIKENPFFEQILPT